METKVGDGNSTLFWTDNWLQGSSIANIAPHIFAQVSKQNRNKRTVSEALPDDQWTQDIIGALNVAALTELLGLVDLLDEVQLVHGVEDEHRLQLWESGQYSSKSAYKSFFIAAIHFQPWQLI
ncbi:hypothetical protein PR202_ga12425 [Eleusine coracana subsp. coracana]|uniref:Uncharacterized protein n=1 Tax=Eleusine coracana subsp. coracana TaxID=191504 RepID=A0AAV5CC31_ELECO|nr:hypothetical protein PR202_ga12425 [Eleusine coracana subsp. coracana]